MSLLRLHAEQQFSEELDQLSQFDSWEKPAGWRLSPRCVVMYIMGGQLPNKFQVSPKYIGNQRLIEIAVATLTTDRALLLYGLPGTAKSWVSEHLAAAISGNSTLLVQGTNGLGEENIRYGWNYARLLAEGPTNTALVPSPVMRGMTDGKIVRVEELTRISSDVQDALITVLSEKLLPIPELNTEIQAVEGFNLIATANNRDKGVNELSGALKRRFNTVILPTPETIEEEMKIIEHRIVDLNKGHLKLADLKPSYPEIERIVTIFRELRNGVTHDGRNKIKSPSGAMSTAEAISVINSGIALSRHFGSGHITANDLASALIGSIIKDPVQDQVIWQEYLQTIMKGREKWKDLYQACKQHL